MQTGKVKINNFFTWAYARSGRSSDAQFSVKGGGDESGQDLEASAADSESASGGGESDSEDAASEIGTPNAEAPVTANAGLTFSRKHYAIREGLVPALVSANTPDQPRVGFREDKARRLAEHIPGSRHFRSRTHGGERRVRTDQQGIVSLEDECARRGRGDLAKGGI